MVGPSTSRQPMSHRKTDLGIPRCSKSAKVVLGRVLINVHVCFRGRPDVPLADRNLCFFRLTTSGKVPNLSIERCSQRLQPKLISFDVFGTLISVRESSYGAFERILDYVGTNRVDVKAFWEHWEHRNIAHYWEPYRTYRQICELSLEETFAHFGLTGEASLISHYF